MTIIINGEEHRTSEGNTLAGLIAELGYGTRGIAVAIEGRVVPKDKWSQTILTEHMELMLIHAVSGG